MCHLNVPRWCCQYDANVLWCCAKICFHALYSSSCNRRSKDIMPEHCPSHTDFKVALKCSMYTSMHSARGYLVLKMSSSKTVLKATVCQHDFTLFYVTSTLSNFQYTLMREANRCPRYLRTNWCSTVHIWQITRCAGLSERKFYGRGYDNGAQGIVQCTRERTGISFKAKHAGHGSIQASMHSQVRGQTEKKSAGASVVLRKKEKYVTKMSESSCGYCPTKA